MASADSDRKAVSFFESEREFTPDITTAVGGASLDPAVRGDFQAVVPIDDQSIGMVVGDVSGCGGETQRLAADLRDGVAQQLKDGRSPGEILTHVNDVLVPTTPDDQIATAFVAKVDRATGAVTYAGAGHEPALVAPEEAAENHGQVAELPSEGLPLGIEPARYEDRVSSLPQDSTLLLYSNGATNARQEETVQSRLGRSGFKTFLARFAGLPAGKLIAALLRHVLAHCGRRLRDDISLLALRRGHARISEAAASEAPLATKAAQ